MNLELGTRIWVTMIPLGRGRMAWRDGAWRGKSNPTVCDRSAVSLPGGLVHDLYKRASSEER